MASQRVLAFLDVPAECRRCDWPAYTKRLGGRVPMHPMCDPDAWVDAVPLGELLDLMHLLGERFGGAVRDPPVPKALPHEIGPCMRCHRSCRRYGPFGAMFCTDCRKKDQ